MKIVQDIKDAAQEVFEGLGNGHSEAVYESAMGVELALRNIGPIITRQVPCPIIYKGITVGVGYIDIHIHNIMLLELKAVTKLTNKDEQQVRKYLTGTGLKFGLLINFGTASEEVDIVEVHSVDCYINDDPRFSSHAYKCPYPRAKTEAELYIEFLDSSSDTNRFENEEFLNYPATDSLGTEENEQGK